MTVTLKDNAPLIVPPSLRRRAGLKPGDKLEFQATRGVITIRAAAQSPDDDECTPEQRRTILADARAGLKEIEEGKFYGPFGSGAELGRFVEGEVRKEEARKRKRIAK
jgi:bifunctional DNA-binding transcriptional regulator/antitoxin component of YhaV-PrlF toxin-antitoxin module